MYISNDFPTTNLKSATLILKGETRKWAFCLKETYIHYYKKKSYLRLKDSKQHRSIFLLCKFVSIKLFNWEMYGYLKNYKS